MLPRAPLASCLFLVLATGACRSGSSASPSAPSTTSTAKLAVTSSSYNFPTALLVGDVAQSPAIQVSASGSGSLTISNITTSNPSEFPLVNEASCIGMSLTSAATACQIAVKFKPSAAGVRSAQILVTASDGTNAAIAITGTSVANGSSGSGGDAGGGAAGGGGGGAGGGSGGSGGGSFPQPPCVPNNTSNISLSVTNTTSIVIGVTATGPTPLNATINPGHVQVFPTLEPGNYTLDGSAPATSNAQFFPSTWTVVRGCDYLMQVVAKPVS
jgi:hypothetical protein